MDSLKIKNTNIDLLIPLIKECLEKDNSVTLTPYGNSMLPMMNGGKDTVTISKIKNKLKKYDLPLYVRNNGQYVIHRIVGIKNGCYVCIGDNMFSCECDVKDSMIIGIVTSFTHNRKHYRTDCLSYRIYCVIWDQSRFFRRCIRKLATLIKYNTGD